MLLTPEIVRDTLIKLGWMPTTPSDSPFVDALKSFQAFYGLEPDGQVDTKTEKTLTRRVHYGCGNTDAQQTGNLCQWPAGMEVKYCVARTPSSMDEEEARLAFRRAFTSWEQVCGIRFVELRDPTSANIVISTGRGRRVGFDGPSGVLAWSHLPCGNVGTSTKLEQYYDDAETFGASAGGGVIVLENVACHEIGHAIGISHIAPALGQALMNPTYSSRIPRPLPLDIEQGMKRYGKVSGGPNPPAPPPNETQRTIVITGARAITVDGVAI